MPIEDSISLPIILAWVRKNSLKILLGGMVFAVLALPVAFLKAKTYESEVMLLISPPTFKDRPKLPIAKDQGYLQESISEMMPKTLPMETYKVLALSPPVLAEVIRKVPLDNTGVKSLSGRLNAELVQMGSRSAQTGIMYVQALTLRAKANDPEMAAKTVQVWAEAFKAEVDKTAAKGVNDTFSLLEKLHDTTRTEYEQADLALAAHKKQWDLELVKTQVEAKQKDYTEFESSLKLTEVDLASSTMKLTSLEADLALEPEKKVYFRAPSDDAYWIAGLENGKSKSDPDKGLRTEEPNPNYVKIRDSVVTTKEEIEGLKAKKEAILLKLDDLKKEMEALNATLTDQTVERNKLAREVESLKDSYTVVRAEYEKGRMADQTQASDIVIAGNAIVPDAPSSVSNPKLVLFAALVGMFLTGALLLAKELSELAPLPDLKPIGSHPDATVAD